MTVLEGTADRGQQVEDGSQDYCGGKRTVRVNVLVALARTLDVRIKNLMGQN